MLDTNQKNFVKDLKPVISEIKALNERYLGKYIEENSKTYFYEVSKCFKSLEDFCKEQISKRTRGSESTHYLESVQEASRLAQESLNSLVNKNDFSRIIKNVVDVIEDVKSHEFKSSLTVLNSSKVKNTLVQLKISIEMICKNFDDGYDQSRKLDKYLESEKYECLKILKAFINKCFDKNIIHYGDALKQIRELAVYKNYFKCVNGKDRTIIYDELLSKYKKEKMSLKNIKRNFEYYNFSETIRLILQSNYNCFYNKIYNSFLPTLKEEFQISDNALKDFPMIRDFEKLIECKGLLSEEVMNRINSINTVLEAIKNVNLEPKTKYEFIQEWPKYQIIIDHPPVLQVPLKRSTVH